MSIRGLTIETITRLNLGIKSLIFLPAIDSLKTFHRNQTKRGPIPGPFTII